MKDLNNIFAGVAGRILDANPGLAIFLGISKYFGTVFELSKDNIRNTLILAKKDLENIENILEENELEKIQKLEASVLKAKLGFLIFQLEDYKEFENHPAIYFISLSSIEGQYASKSYASVDIRIGHIISTYEQMIKNIENAPLLLDKKLPKDIIQISLLFLQSFTGYLGDKLIEFILTCTDKDLIQKWSEANEKMLTTLKNFKELLVTGYMQNSTEEFAIGYEKYSKMVKFNELVDLTPEELLATAERDMERNYKNLMTILDDKGEDYLEVVLNDYPDVKNLFKEAGEATARSKQFVIDKDLMTIPTDDQVEIVESPDAMKNFAFAAMNQAGVGEDSKAKESYYYITPPDPKWDKDTTHKYMRSFARGSLEAITIHEVWPGHFYHGLWIKGLSSKILRQVGYSSTTLEGWAHYCEEMVIEEGYDLIDPLKLQVCQLSWAIVRNCRFVSSIKMHTQGMTVEESTKLFMEKGFMSKEAAIKEARRGTFNPTYYNYTLGKLMILKLREDYKKEKGDKFTLKGFHDDFVQYGTPEILLLRQMLLQNPGDSKDLL